MIVIFHYSYFLQLFWFSNKRCGCVSVECHASLEPHSSDTTPGRGSVSAVSSQPITPSCAGSWVAQSSTHPTPMAGNVIVIMYWTWLMSSTWPFRCVRFHWRHWLASRMASTGCCKQCSFSNWQSTLPIILYIPAIVCPFPTSQIINFCIWLVFQQSIVYTVYLPTIAIMLWGPCTLWHCNRIGLHAMILCYARQ